MHAHARPERGEVEDVMPIYSSLYNYAFLIIGLTLTLRVPRYAHLGFTPTRSLPTLLPEPRMRLAVRGVPTGALRTHSA